jgi:hypothetical protein
MQFSGTGPVNRDIPGPLTAFLLSLTSQYPSKLFSNLPANRSFSTGQDLVINLQLHTRPRTAGLQLEAG